MEALRICVRILLPLLLVSLSIASQRLVLAKVCPPGQGNFYEDTCENCWSGFYSVVKGGKSTCEVCPSGTYCPKDGCSKCTPCPPGTTSGYGSPSLSSCFKCYESPLTAPKVPQPDGQGGNSCLPCANFTYASPDRTKCLTCPPGKFINNFRTCETCPPGTYFNGNRLGPTVSASCTPCGHHQYQDKRGQPRCLSCPPGTMVLAVGSTSKAACKPYLTGKKIFFVEDIYSSESLVFKTGCYSSATLLVLNKRWTKPAARTIISGKKYPCSAPISKWVQYTNGIIASKDPKGQKTFCQSYTFFLHSGNKFSMAVDLKVFQSVVVKVLTGAVANKMTLKYKGEYINLCLGAQMLNETMTWNNVKVL